MSSSPPRRSGEDGSARRASQEGVEGLAQLPSLVEDNRRQNRLVAAGIRLLRFTASDVLRSPDSVTMQVRGYLASRVD